MSSQLIKSKHAGFVLREAIVIFLDKATNQQPRLCCNSAFVPGMESKVNPTDQQVAIQLAAALSGYGNTQTAAQLEQVLDALKNSDFKRGGDVELVSPRRAETDRQILVHVEPTRAPKHARRVTDGDFPVAAIAAADVPSRRPSFVQFGPQPVQLPAEDEVVRRESFILTAAFKQHSFRLNEAVRRAQKR